MEMDNNIAFQSRTVDNLIEKTKRLWKLPSRQITMVLEAPTGSGKTYMVERTINELAEQPDWNHNVAYVWITFSDELAMQSKDKFDTYFPTSKHGRLLTKDDFNLGHLQKNDVLFLNWEKFVVESAEKRLLRRPEDPRLRHESRVYFEDFIENTHKKGLDIILIVDESHRNVTESAVRDVINPLDPKLKLYVSATPTNDSIAEAARNNAYEKIEYDEVVEAGLIKKSLICQTEEDLKKYPGEGDTEKLVKLAIDKRKEIKAQIEKFGNMDFNPLALIQLPNDNAVAVEQGQQTEEEYVKQILIENGIKENNIASWFSDKEKPVGLELENNHYEFLLFKTAAGTGWDCPRAQILVMLRPIGSETFETQTLGRIIRVPIRKKAISVIFENGYIYTNFSRNAVLSAKYDTTGGNKPKIYIATNNIGEDFIIDEKLVTEFISRIDYGDLRPALDFQECFEKTFDDYFGLEKDDILESVISKVINKGLNLNGKLEHDVLQGLIIKNTDVIDLREANQACLKWNRLAVEKIFNNSLVGIMKEQTDNDCKIGGIVRSFSVLKTAIRKCLSRILPEEDSDTWYRVFINDAVVNSNTSVFKVIITQALKNFHPLQEQYLKNRREAEEKRKSVTFVLKKIYAYTEDYEEIPAKKCLFDKFYLRKDYDGRENEIKFAEYLDSIDQIEWWFKNGDQGKDWFGIRYYNTEENRLAMFYPDWIFKMQDGTISIFDTKAGRTASEKPTKDKAEELYRRLKELNSLGREDIRYVGGVVIKANGTWYYNDNETYEYHNGSTDGWKLMSDLFC